MAWRSIVACVALGFSMACAVRAADPSPAAGADSKYVGHNLYFSLNDPSDENKAKLIDASTKYLSQHSGIVFFAVGTRDEKLSGGFNDKNYDVALHMVFNGREALSKYAKTNDHQQFVKEMTPLFKSLRIFD